MLRFISNVIFVILLAAMLAVGWGIWKYHEAETHRYAAAHAAVSRIQREVNIRMASEDSPLNEFGFPPTVDPEWFGEHLPMNALLDHERPWLEIATGSDMLRLHPRDPVAITREHAEYWYNPRRGVVRARVPQMVSDRQTLELYNLINETRLGQLFPTSLPDRSDGDAEDRSVAADRSIKSGS